MTKQNPGWRKDSQEHKLASKGIKIKLAEIKKYFSIDPVKYQEQLHNKIFIWKDCEDVEAKVLIKDSVDEGWLDAEVLKIKMNGKWVSSKGTEKDGTWQIPIEELSVDE